ncbi:MAG: hypothetical protein VX589_08175, partial [Myxococcota bacterium]|nr:hypothetical protein [Myxococcota bacterium]
GCIMKMLITLMNTVVIAVSMYLTGCLAEELPTVQGRQVSIGGVESGRSHDDTDPGLNDGESDGENVGALPEAVPPIYEDDIDDVTGSPVCLGPDGRVAWSCDDGFRCVETCESDCDDEVCSAICRIGYRCEAANDANLPDDGDHPEFEFDEDDDDTENFSPESEGEYGDNEEDGDDTEGSSVCWTPTGEIALECGAGEVCVQVCADDCEDEICPQICRIDYRCEPGHEAPGGAMPGDEFEGDDDENDFVVGGGDTAGEGDENDGVTHIEIDGIGEGDGDDGDHGGSPADECSPEGEPGAEACDDGFRCEAHCINECESEECPAICYIVFVCIAEE